MPTSKKMTQFFDLEEERSVRQELERMARSGLYNTAPSYTANAKYPDNLIPFVDKHMNYLNTKPQLDAWKYVANLKLMTRIRGK